MNRLYSIKTVWSTEYVVAVSMSAALAKLDRKLKGEEITRQYRRVQEIKLLGEVVL